MVPWPPLMLMAAVGLMRLMAVGRQEREGERAGTGPTDPVGQAYPYSVCMHICMYVCTSQGQ